MGTARTSRFVRQRPLLAGEAFVGALIIAALAVDVVTAVLELPPDTALSVWAVGLLGPVLAALVLVAAVGAAVRAWRSGRVPFGPDAVAKAAEAALALGVAAVVGSFAALRLVYGPGGGGVVIMLFAVGAILSVLLAAVVVGHAAVATVRLPNRTA